MSQVALLENSLAFRDAYKILHDYAITKALFDRVKKRVGFSFAFAPLGNAPALWDSKQKKIFLNSCKLISGELDRNMVMSLIVFECFNALQNDSLARLHKRAIKNLISKTGYVEGIEKIEHRSAVRCAELVQKAISDRIFPKNMPMGCCFLEFNDFYKYQQLAGHAQGIADRYDRLNPRGVDQRYKGTWKPSVRGEDKEELLYLYFLKARILYRRQNKVYEERLKERLRTWSQIKDPQSQRIFAAVKNFLDPTYWQVNYDGRE